jgi:hypothetical protein
LICDILSQSHDLKDKLSSKANHGVHHTERSVVIEAINKSLDQRLRAALRCCERGRVFEYAPPKFLVRPFSYGIQMGDLDIAIKYLSVMAIVQGLTQLYAKPLDTRAGEWPDVKSTPTSSAHRIPIRTE